MGEILSFLTELGFTPRDLALVKGCAGFAALGSFIQALVSYWPDLSKIPTEERQRVSAQVALSRLVWLIAKVVAGAAIGLVLGLYLVGALTEGSSVAARIFAFAVLVGYSAPSVWENQERVVQRIVKAQLEKVRGG